MGSRLKDFHKFLYLGLKSVKKFQVWLVDKKENHFTARLTKIYENISLMSSWVDI